MYNAQSNPHITAPKNYSAVDLFKLIASILVVSIHTHPLHSIPNADYILTCICRIAVPFFFVFSSFIFYEKNNTDIKYYALRIGKLYLFWFILEFPFVVERFFILRDTSFTINVLYFFKNLLIQNTFYASWYLTALLEGMVIVYILHSKKKHKLLTTISIVCGVLALLGSSYRFLISDIAGYKYIQLFFKIFTPSNSFIVAIPYCTLGLFLAKNQGKHFPVQTLWWIFLLLVAGWVMEIIYSCFYANISSNGTDAFICLFAIAPILVLLLTQINIQIKRNIQILFRNLSILIYLSHGVINHCLYQYCGITKGMLMFTLTLLLSILFSLAIIQASKRVTLFKNAY